MVTLPLQKGKIYIRLDNLQAWGRKVDLNCLARELNREGTYTTAKISERSLSDNMSIEEANGGKKHWTTVPTSEKPPVAAELGDIATNVLLNPLEIRVFNIDYY